MSALPTITRVEMVIQAIRSRISSRKLMSGSKLPSVRSIAASLKVSVSTAVEAYDRLAAAGTITARRGSGFFVTSHAPPFSLAAIGPRLERTVDPLWLSRQSLASDDQVLKPGCGWLPESWMPVEGLQRNLRTLARLGGKNLTDYSTPLGYAPLRQMLAQRMGEHGISADPNQILLTESGTQAIDLLCRYLLEPGDAVLVDDPCYFNFQAMLRAHRAKVIGVPYERTGPNLELFEHALIHEKPRLYITNSGLHNPTGATLSAPTAYAVLKLAERHKLMVIEDDIFADFEMTPSPRLAAFDALNCVIHIGSFSKTLSASLRCGYIAVRPDWIEGLIDLKIAISFGSSDFSAAIIDKMLRDGTYRKHLNNLRSKLAEAMGHTTNRLSALDIKPWLQPKGGLFLWCILPDNLNSSQIAEAALTEDVVLAPGNAFSTAQTASKFMRFNVAQSLNSRIYSVLERTMKETHSNTLARS